MDEELDKRLNFLEESKHSHINLVRILSGQIGLIHIYAWMVLKRSISLCFGFITMIREKNFICAAPLIRLQIDNLLRFRAAFLVSDQDQFVLDVIEGKHIRNLIDRSGNKMTDDYLQKVLSNEYPWLKQTYYLASGYIHLSEQHFVNTVRLNEKKSELTFQAYIGPNDKFLPDDTYKNALEDMILVTYSLLNYLAEWAKSITSQVNE